MFADSLFAGGSLLVIILIVIFIVFIMRGR